MEEMTLEEFLTTYPDTDTNRHKDNRVVIEAYNQEGDVLMFILAELLPLKIILS